VCLITSSNNTKGKTLVLLTSRLKKTSVLPITSHNEWRTMSLLEEILLVVPIRQW
jgi:hypothetical protein